MSLLEKEINKLQTVHQTEEVDEHKEEAAEPKNEVDEHTVDNERDTSGLVHINEVKRQRKVATLESRGAAKTKDHKKFGREVNNKTAHELLVVLDTAEDEKRRVFNSTATVNKKELATIALAKIYSGLNGREILLQACADIIKKEKRKKTQAVKKEK